MKFVFASDLHIRPDRPVCRKDEDWIDTQFQQLLFLTGLAEKNNCPIVLGGDVFDQSQVPDSLKNMVVGCFVGLDVYGIAGQHDLVYHSYKNIHKSSFGVLWQTGIIKDPTFGSFAHFGTDIIVSSDESILFKHELVFENEKSMPPNVRAKTAEQVLEENPDYNWIFLGDQHHGFHYRKQGKHVIMGGCFNRQAADFVDYEPVVWLVDTDNNVVEKIPVPDNVNMVSNQHLQIKKDREGRIEAFVSLVGGKKKVTLDFEENVRRELKQNSLSKGAVEEVNILMEA